jgi:hypothetical protein
MEEITEATLDGKICPTCGGELKLSCLICNPPPVKFTPKSENLPPLNKDQRYSRRRKRRR